MKAASSPRTWGCFYHALGVIGEEYVFPTHVGVFLILLRCHLAGCRLPHARGGVSPALAVVADTGMSSPRTWGCFLNLIDFIPASEVFPTHVGVFLSSPCDRRSGECLPHARGGVSEIQQEITGMLSSSPRTWGCFYLPPALPVLALVFPTHVGVFPKSSKKSPGCFRLPHARGGVSTCRLHCLFLRWSSPRTWGCFPPAKDEERHPAVFPTHVGVFFRSLSG